MHELSPIDAMQVLVNMYMYVNQLPVQSTSNVHVYAQCKDMECAYMLTALQILYSITLVL